MNSRILDTGSYPSNNICKCFPLQIFRLSDLLCVWPNTNYVHRAKSAALISFLRTQIGMKARLDIVRAYQQLVHGDNIDQGIFSGSVLCISVSHVHLIIDALFMYSTIIMCLLLEVRSEDTLWSGRVCPIDAILEPLDSLLIK